MTRLTLRHVRVPEPTLNPSSDSTTATVALHGTIMGIMAMLSIGRPANVREFGLSRSNYRRLRAQTSAPVSASTTNTRAARSITHCPTRPKRRPAWRSCNNRCQFNAAGTLAACKSDNIVDGTGTNGAGCQSPEGAPALPSMSGSNCSKRLSVSRISAPAATPRRVKAGTPWAGPFWWGQPASSSLRRSAVSCPRRGYDTTC